jgi:prepilin peptidase CpaA
VNELHLVIAVLAIGMLALVVWEDVRWRRIPNAVSAAVAGLGLMRLALAGDGEAMVFAFAAAALVFLGALILFWRGWLGGGDAKLLGAVPLLIGAHDVPVFLVLTSLLGGVLALAVLAGARLGGPFFYLLPAGAAAEPAGRPSVPYGVAIALAAGTVLVLQTSFLK